MKIKLPFIGNVSTGKDVEPVIQSISLPKQKDALLLGSLLDLGSKALSDDKTVSSKLIEAFYEWVFINVTTLSEEISKLEPELYKMVLVSGEWQLQEIESHPLLDLLDRFNDTTTRSDGFYLTEAHLDLTGDSFWYLEGGAGGAQPSNIYLLQPDKTEIKLGDISKGASRLIDGYTYKTVIDGKTIATEYEPEEILPIKVPNPKNPYRGFSVVEGIATSLDIDTATLEGTKKFFENGMMAQFMLTTDNKLTQDQLKKLKAEMRAAYAGAQNFWKVPIFGGGIKPESVQMSSRDAQTIEQQTWLRDKIMAAFKNTKSSLGITEDVNRANAEASLLGWKRSVIRPKMARIVNALNEYLVPRYGDNLVLGFCDPVPEDKSQKITDAVALFNANIITLNEARDLVEYDQIQGGDDINQQQPATENNLPKSLQHINFKQVLRRKSLVQKKADWEKAYNAAKPVAKNMLTKEVLADKISADVKIHTNLTNDQVWDFWKKQIHIVEMLESQFENKLKQFIGGIVKDGVSKLDNRENLKDSSLLNKDKLITEAVAKFTPILTEVLVSSGNHANRLLKLDTPYIPKAMKAFDVREQVRKQIEMFAGSMVDTDEEAMVDIITAGLQEGSSIPAIKQAITEKFDVYTKTQAERITRTEVLKASNYGLEDAYAQSGVVVGKQWLTAGDPCPECAEFDGMIVDLGDEYAAKGDTVGNLTLDYSNVENPPLHPNCRCTILPVLEGAKSFDNNATLKATIAKLESQIDKRKKEFRELKAKRADDIVYIKALEKYLEQDGQIEETPET